MSSVLRRPLPAIPQRGFSEAMQHALLVDNLLSCGNVKDAVLIDLKDFSYISANPGFEVRTLLRCSFHNLTYIILT